MTGHRGNPGLRGRLLNKSVDAYVLAIETFNRLSAKYRVEAFCYLVCNAWERLLKGKILDDTRKRSSIYFPKVRKQQHRTLALRDCIKRMLPNEKDPIRAHQTGRPSVCKRLPIPAEKGTSFTVPMGATLAPYRSGEFS